MAYCTPNPPNRTRHVARPRYDVVVRLSLPPNELRDELGLQGWAGVAQGASAAPAAGTQVPAAEAYVVREIRVHEEDEIARGKLEAVNVRAPEAKLATALEDLQAVAAKNTLQCQGDFVRAVRAAVLHDDDLVVEFAAAGRQEGTIRQARRASCDTSQSHFSTKTLSRRYIMSGKFSRSLYYGKSGWRGSRGGKVGAYESEF